MDPIVRYIIAGGAIFIAIKFLQTLTLKKICKTCGYIGRPKSKVKGNIGVELFLWLIGIISLFIFPLFILVPLFYSLWRIFSPRQKICPKCEHPSMIPLDSPFAKELLNKLKPIEEPQNIKKSKETKPLPLTVEPNFLIKKISNWFYFKDKS